MIYMIWYIWYDIYDMIYMIWYIWYDIYDMIYMKWYIWYDVHDMIYMIYQYDNNKRSGYRQSEKISYWRRIIVIYWMTIISFIFHFTRDLVFMLQFTIREPAPHCRRKGMAGQTSIVLDQVWTFPGSWKMSACQGVNYWYLLDFFSSAPGWWRILKLASTEPPWPRSSCNQKGWMASPSKTALFHPSWWSNRNQNTTLWVCQAPVYW